AKKSRQQQLPPPAFFDPSQVPAEHVIQLGAPASVLLAGSHEESSSEQMWDETAGDTELDASGTAPAEVVSLESTDVVIPADAVQGHAVVSLEQEVDWEAEHTRFHQRYVDVHPADRTPAHGLMDELRDPASLRRAVLLAEILGSPKSMRGR
ncbi:MAG TPA: hypothetical protein VFR37_01615, partial [Longimicrobium sp.]|nr:hypothetical protein [Longimicrobium sp.]